MYELFCAFLFSSPPPIQTKMSSWFSQFELPYDLNSAPCTQHRKYPVIHSAYEIPLLPLTKSLIFVYKLTVYEFFFLRLSVGFVLRVDAKSGIFLWCHSTLLLASQATISVNISFSFYLLSKHVCFRRGLPSQIHVICLMNRTPTKHTSDTFKTTVRSSGRVFS